MDKAHSRHSLRIRLLRYSVFEIVLSRHPAVRDQGNDTENQATTNRNGAIDTQRRDGRAASTAGEAGIKNRLRVAFQNLFSPRLDTHQRRHSQRHRAESWQSRSRDDADRLRRERARNTPAPSGADAAVHQAQAAVRLHERARRSVRGSSRRQWEWL